MAALPLRGTGRPGTVLFPFDCSDTFASPPCPASFRSAGASLSADRGGGAKAEALESVVLFALDQFALIGYPVPVGAGSRRAVFLG